MKRYDYESALIRHLLILVAVVIFAHPYEEMWWMVGGFYFAVLVRLFQHHCADLAIAQRTTRLEELRVRRKHGFRASYLWPLIALWVVLKSVFQQKK